MVAPVDVNVGDLQVAMRAIEVQDGNAAGGQVPAGSVEELEVAPEDPPTDVLMGWLEDEVATIEGGDIATEALRAAGVNDDEPGAQGTAAPADASAAPPDSAGEAGATCGAVSAARAAPGAVPGA